MGPADFPMQIDVMKGSILFYIGLVVLLATTAEASPNASSSDNESTSLHNVLKKVVRTSRSHPSYRLNVRYHIEMSDRKDPINIQSHGIFQSPHYRLRSETPAGMEVLSFGKNQAVVHIHPSTDEVVTSRRLGISSVNRTLLDPFEHMDYLLDPSYEETSMSLEGTMQIDGSTFQVLRVEAGTDQVRDVMNKFRDQLERPLKPKKTVAVYRVFYDDNTSYIRRIRLTVDSELVEQEKDSISEDLQEELPRPRDREGSPEGSVQMHVEGTFDLTNYGEVEDLSIPADVERKLRQIRKK